MSLLPYGPGNYGNLWGDYDDGPPETKEVAKILPRKGGHARVVPGSLKKLEEKLEDIKQKAKQQNITKWWHAVNNFEGSAAPEEPKPSKKPEPEPKEPPKGRRIIWK